MLGDLSVSHVSASSLYLELAVGFINVDYDHEDIGLLGNVGGFEGYSFIRLLLSQASFISMYLEHAALLVPVALS